MPRRIFALFFTLSFFTVFLLFGSLHLKWSNGKEGPLLLNISLDFHLTPPDKLFAHHSWGDNLMFAFNNSFGMKESTKTNSSHQVDAQSLRVTPESILARFNQLIQIQNEPQRDQHENTI
jgi:hypothetical protein